MKLVSVGISLLGFDPWSESRQGLANLLEEETRPAPHVAQPQFSHVSSAPRPGFPFRGNIDRVSSSDANRNIPEYSPLRVYMSSLDLLCLSVHSSVCIIHVRPSCLCLYHTWRLFVLFSKGPNPELAGGTACSAPEHQHQFFRWARTAYTSRNRRSIVCGHTRQGRMDFWKGANMIIVDVFESYCWRTVEYAGGLTRCKSLLLSCAISSLSRSMHKVHVSPL